MLEVDGIDQKPEAPQPEQKKERPTKDYKVVVEQEEFDRNLQKARLKEKVTEIERKKIDLRLATNIHKSNAYKKFLLGIVIIFFALRSFFEAKEEMRLFQVGDDEWVYELITHRKILSREGILTILGLIAVFTLIYYIRKGKKK